MELPEKHFNVPINEESLSVGLYSKRKCMWSTAPLISLIKTSIDLAFDVSFSYNVFKTGCDRTFLRNLVTKTT